MSCHWKINEIQCKICSETASSYENSQWKYQVKAGINSNISHVYDLVSFLVHGITVVRKCRLEIIKKSENRSMGFELALSNGGIPRSL